MNGVNVEEETIEEEVKVDEPKDEIIEEEIDEESRESDVKETPDENYYKELLQKEKDARERAEERLNKTREKAKERWANKKDNYVDDDDEIPEISTDEKIEEMIDKRYQAFEKKMLDEKIDAKINQLSSNDSEKKAIKEIYNNRSFPDYLTLEEKLNECYVITNKDKLIGERNEALKSIIARPNTNPAVGVKEPSENPVKDTFTAEEKKAMKLQGFTKNAKGLYEKKVANTESKYFIKNPDTRESFVEVR